MWNDFLRILLLSGIAGLATGIGGAIAFFSKKDDKNFLALTLGFSSGVMIYISFMELLPDAVKGFGEKGPMFAGLYFFIGIFISFIIDKLIPECENPHEFHNQSDFDDQEKMLKFRKSGIMVALAITVHNFPEGLAVAGASLDSWKLGWSIALAVAIHNIPEGMAVSLPIFYATKSRKKALLYSSLSGLAEPIGAVLGFFILRSFLSESFLSVIFAAVSGIMVFISFDELMPLAEKYGEHHRVIAGIVAGMFFIYLMLHVF
jgi:ZIP family zinc transporter